VQVPVDNVTYRDELAHHDMVWAEGLPAETYLDVGDRASFGNGARAIQLFPDFAARFLCVAMAWETQACAELFLHGPRLEAVRTLVNPQTLSNEQEDRRLRGNRKNRAGRG
jgi:hypothetical protein